MAKFVYKNNNRIVVLDQEVEGAEIALASIADLKEEIEKINNELNFKWEYGESPLGFNDILGFDLSEALVLKEDVFIWDAETEKFETIESIQTLDNPYSWTNKEKSEFAEILLSWIMCNDHTYDLYKFIRQINEDYKYAPYARDESTEKFERLLKKELDINHKMLEHYETHYDNEKLLTAKVEGGVN